MLWQWTRPEQHGCPLCLDAQLPGRWGWGKGDIKGWRESFTYPPPRRVTELGLRGGGIA